MPARKRPRIDAKTRLKRITELARELVCDKDQAAFRTKLGEIARHKSWDEAETVMKK